MSVVPIVTGRANDVGRVVPPPPPEPIPTPSNDFSSIDFLPLSTPPTAPAQGAVYYDDGTNRVDPLGNPGLRAYNGSAWEDIPFVSSGSDSGATSLVLTCTDATFGMIATTSYHWIQVGGMLLMKALVQWTTNTGAGTFGVTIPSFLPANCIGPTDPSQFGVAVDSYSGINLTGNWHIAARIADGSRTLTLLKADPVGGAGMDTLKGADLDTGGILYLTAMMKVAQRAS